MLSLNRDQAKSVLSNLVRPEAELPEFIFGRHFDGYSFFDADIGTNDEFVDALQRIVKQRFGSTVGCHVFSGEGAEYLSALSMEDEWSKQIAVLTKALRSDGDCGALMLLGDSGAWVAVQRRPVDIGVFAFDLVDEDGGSSPLEADCFFDCREISGWLAGSSERDAALRESLGVDFLTSMVKNYCDK